MRWVPDRLKPTTSTYEAFIGSPVSIVGDFSLYNDGSDIIQSLSGTVDGSAITSLLGGYYIAGVLDVGFTTAADSYQLNGGNLISLMFTGDDLEVPTSLGTLTIGAVPLPASAPLFGAALLALGAVGYGLKRRQTATA